MTFTDRLRALQRRKQTVLCVGLDPDPARLPRPLRRESNLITAVRKFLQHIIDATSHVACAYKFNLAFFEALGRDGWSVLEATLQYMPDGVMTIADGKRGDIGSSARFYARAVFELLPFDACTVSPYMGRDAVAPFLAYENRAVFVLTRTSNPGARDFQERRCDNEPLYLTVARAVARWDQELPGTAGLVVGATDPYALAAVHLACPGLPLLIPGVGAQGGAIPPILQVARRNPVLVNSSRQILYASDQDDFMEAAARAAETLRAQLTAACPI
ncbi:orotidine-5'-phosphate decarboxylase [Rhodothermus profundi]|uniref:Orotidine 5'-phosphate decarboxylase n=1 Tax=Rhodothermus profundi TaxID=633813 RepID=A0A1M6PFW0_9BACT|nr:orotidine-5'-phosphate decarboxylase [Rhodothermus profundi]SHK06835.1 orotidine-5'-phosphate decarboxylase [Rhodothermus profundi]